MQCDDIAAKLRSYVTALAQKTSPYLRDYLVALLYQYMQNRIYDLAMKHMVNTVFEEIGGGFWSWVGEERQRRECLTLLEICINAVSDHGQALRHEIASLRAS